MCTAVDDVSNCSSQLPCHVPEKTENGETDEYSGEEIYQRHKDYLTVKQNNDNRLWVNRDDDDSRVY